MRVVFMGTPDFAATILEDLVEQHDVCAVYTRADAIRGRGKGLEPSPVKRMAQKHGIPVYEPLTLKDPSTVEQLRLFEPEAICVAAYGMILPAEVLEIPAYGCLNVHASLLPKWRGAAPVERAILADECDTGVCIMRMEEGLDTGDYCIIRTAHIEEKSAERLSDELANLGSHALLTALVHIEKGITEWTKQDESQASYAAKIRKDELHLSLEDTARMAVLKVRASSTAHPSRCLLADRRVRLEEVQGIEEDDALIPHLRDMLPGRARFIQKRLILTFVDGAVEVLKLKPDGKKSMDAKSFAAGLQISKENDMLWGALDV